MSSASQRLRLRSEASKWIFSPFWDTLLFIAAPLVSIALFLPLRQYFSSQQIAIVLLAFFTFGHHLPGFIRAYGDHELFARYRARFLIAPPVIFAVSLWFDFKGLHGLIVFLFAWDVWHVLMQHYGFMRIYDAKRREFSSLTAWMDWGISISWYLALIVASPHYRTNLLMHAYNSGVPPISLEMFLWLQMSVYTLTGLVTSGYLVYNVYLWRKGRLNPRKLALLATFLFATYWLYVYLDDFLLGFVVWSAFHCIQYYGIVWAFNVNRVASGSPVTVFVRFLFRPRVMLVAAYAVLILAYGGINYLQSFIGSDSSLRLLLAFLFTSNALHYYYDSFIWKIREPQTREYLGKAEVGAASQPVRHIRPVKRGRVQAACLGAMILCLGALETWRMPDAVGTGRALIAVAPDVGDAHYSLATALWRRGSLAEAAEEYQKAGRLMRPSSIVHANLGAVLAEQGRLTEAIAHYRQALELHERESKRHLTDSPLAPLSRSGQTANLFTIYANLADALVRNGSGTEAIGYYRSALEIDSRAADLRANLGATLAGLGLHKEGIFELEEAIRIRPDFGGAKLLLASVEAFIGRTDQALTHYKEAIASLGLVLTPPTAYAQAHVNVGVALAALGRFTEAIEAYQRALALDPHLAAAHLNLGGLLESRGESNRALQHYREAAHGNDAEARRLALAALQSLQ